MKKIILILPLFLMFFACSVNTAVFNPKYKNINLKSKTITIIPLSPSSISLLANHHQNDYFSLKQSNISKAFYKSLKSKAQDNEDLENEELVAKLFNKKMHQYFDNNKKHNVTIAKITESQLKHLNKQKINRINLMKAPADFKKKLIELKKVGIPFTFDLPKYSVLGKEAKESDFLLYIIDLSISNQPRRVSNKNYADEQGNVYKQQEIFNASFAKSLYKSYSCMLWDNKKLEPVFIGEIVNCTLIKSSKTFDIESLFINDYEMLIKAVLNNGEKQ